jgi:hypothetical protein
MKKEIFICKYISLKYEWRERISWYPIPCSHEELQNPWLVEYVSDVLCGQGAVCCNVNRRAVLKKLITWAAMSLYTCASLAV